MRRVERLVQCLVPQYEQQTCTGASPAQANRMIKGLEHLMYEERLRELAVFSPEQRKFRRILPLCKNTWQRTGKNVEPDSISVVPSDRARDNGHKLKYRKDCLKLKCFTLRIVSWEVIESLTLEILSTQSSPGRPTLDDPAWSRLLDYRLSRGAFLPQRFCDSVTLSYNFQAARERIL